MLPGAARACIIGIEGIVLSPGERALLVERPPLGVILFGRNIQSPAQLAALCLDLREALPAGALLLVDQEGGRVARLRPPHWREQPAAARIGRLFEQDRRAGVRAAFLTGALIGLDCSEAGFDVACAPVLDRAVAGAHAVIGDRAFAEGAQAIVALAGALAEGLLSAGVQPVGKHVPGHGRAGLDSHLALPELDRIDDADLAPFAALAWLPWMMTAHIRYRADDPACCATWSRTILDRVVRGRIGFDNLLVSDDLAMQALQGDAGERARLALRAGCDVAMHCSGALADSRAVLQACPLLAPASRERLARAAALAAGSRIALDGAALAHERASLLC